MRAIAWTALLGALLATGAGAQGTAKAPARQTCPVDGKMVPVTPQSVQVAINGSPRTFCDASCRSRF